jgi:DNA-binding NarL/FixJ family response regulator
MPHTDNAHAGERPCRDPRLRMVLADDHAILRRGVCAILNAEIDLEVVGEASNVADTLVLVRDLQPDVLITNVSFDSGDGIKAIGDLRRECSAMRIVLLTCRNSSQGADLTMEAVVDAFLAKDSPVEELLRAIRCRRAEGRPPAIPKLAAQNRGCSTLSPVEVSASGMTERQREVLIGIALGYSSKSIAGYLGRSARTIEKHRLKIMHKLGLRNAAAVARYAIDHGLLDPTRQPQNGPPGPPVAPRRVRAIPLTAQTKSPSADPCKRHP